MINFLMYFCTFVAGTFIGSFLNVVADRLENKESIFFGRSHCDKCKTNLRPKDLIPLLSYAFLKGKCRYCATQLSYYYPLAEILTGLFFVLGAYFVNLFVFSDVATWLYYVYILAIFCVYIVIILSDLKFRIIPNKAVATGVVISVLFTIANQIYILSSLYLALKSDPILGKYLLQTDFFTSRISFALTDFGLAVLSAFLIALFFWFLIVVTKGRGMGGGDVKLAFLIGLFNGLPNNVIAIFSGFLTGALYSVVLIIIGRRKFTDAIPFGPFLILGSLLALFFGSQIIAWYLKLL